MADDFRAIVSQLWAALGLRTPSFGSDASVVLNIDGIDVLLKESADGRHVIVSGSPGRLSQDPQRRGEQVRQLLTANLGFLQSNQSCVSLGSSEDAAPVRVEAVYAYREGRPDLLKPLIEEVLHRVEIHAPDLAADRAAPARAQPSQRAFTAVSQDDFIIRP
jgi:hypothetical protein